MRVPILVMELPTERDIMAVVYVSLAVFAYHEGLLRRFVLQDSAKLRVFCSAGAGVRTKMGTVHPHRRPIRPRR